MSLRAELQQNRPFGSLAEEVFLNLVRTADHLTAAEALFLRDFGLTPAQYNVLRILRGAGPDGLACQEIGARMVSRVPDVTRLLDRLEAQGHVARERSAADRRVVLVRIQTSGSRLLGELDADMAALPRQLLSGLSQRDLKTLNRLCVRARQGTGP